MRRNDQTSNKNTLGLFVEKVALLLAMIGAALAAWILRGVLLILFGALVLAIGMSAIAKLLSNKFRIGYAAGLSVVVLIGLVLIGAIGWFLGAAIGEQLDELAQKIPTDLAEGAFLVILVLFLLLGNFRAALITALVIPIAMLLTMTGMVHGKISANLMSLGALDFGLIVDGAVIIAENSLHLADRQHAFGRQLTEPALDEKNIAMNALRIPSTALSQSQAMQLMVEETIRKFPQVSLVFSKTGTAEVATDPMPPNTSDTFIMLKPREEWPDPKLTKDELQNQIEGALQALAGNSYEFSQPIQWRFNELLAGVRGDVAVKVFGEEFEPMLRVANQIASILRNTNGAEDVKVEQAMGLPFLNIEIDKTEIARLGLSVAAVQDVIGAAIGGRDAGVMFEGDRRFPIVVRLNDEVRENLEALKNLPVPLPPSAQTGRAPAVLLKQVARFKLSEGPNQISRENGKRRVVVTANVRGRDIASLVDEVQKKAAQGVQPPAGYWLTWGGQFENLEAARQRLMIVVPGCFFLIFLLLYTALGSPRDALLVFSAVPLALAGGVFSLWLRGMPFSVSAAVGFIALSGVAVLNGLVMLTFIKQLIEEGTPFFPAIFKGAVTRLRPVAMTALVASLGFVPMALATGTGAEVQKPLATVVIGGLISATLLTLLVLPALYARFGVRKAPSS